ncbi:MAG: S-layer homology domain-containing protein [Clostridiales bacterium]|nr:S-layer homology domain-containing protein [Clostridiales bacterium]
MRKGISFILVLLLVLGIFSFAYGAPKDVTDTKNETAVEVLMALGIIDGYPDGLFKPKNIVTRAEMAKILIAASGYGNVINDAKSSFRDMSGHWADRYVAYAASLGIINGYPDGTFKPNQTVSYAEAATMMVRALGYTDEALVGTWPANYVTKAMVLGLFDNVSTKVGGANRGDIAQMVFELLDKKMGRVSVRDNIFVEYSPEDKMIKRLGAELVDDHPVEPDDNTSSKSYIDLTEYVGQIVDLYKERTGNKKFICVTKVESDVIKGEIDVPNKMLIDKDNKEYKIKSFKDIKIYCNGVERKGVDISEFDDKEVTIAGTLSGVTMTPYSLSGWLRDGIYRVSQSDLYAIEDVLDDEDDEIFDAKVPRDYYDEISDKMKVTGDADELEDIDKDDIVEVYTDDDNEILKLVVSKKTIKGKVTKTTTSPKRIYIDGKAYKVDEALKDFDDYDLGSVIEASLSPDGKLAYFKETDSASAGNYAMVIDTSKGNDDYGIPAKVKLLTKNGEIINFEIDEDADFVSGSNTTALVGITSSGRIALTGAAASAVVPQAIVKYSVNSSKEVTKIILGEYKSWNVAYNSRTNRLGNIELASNAVIFKFNTDDPDKSKIISRNELEDDGSKFPAVYVKKADDNKIVAVSIQSGNVKATDDLYGVVISYGSVLDEDDIVVNEVNMLINGKEKTYLTVDSLSPGIIKNDSFLRIKLTGGKLGDDTEVVRTLGGIIADCGKITDADTDDYVLDIDGHAYEYSDEVTIYVASFNTSGDFDRWKEASQTVLRTGAYAAAYDVYDQDEDELDTTYSIYDTIFVVKKSDLSKVGL